MQESHALDIDNGAKAAPERPGYGGPIKPANAKTGNRVTTLLRTMQLLY